MQWVTRVALACATILLPRLLLAATLPAAADVAPTTWKPIKLGRLPTATEVEAYLLPFFAKFFTTKNPVIRYGSIPVVAGLLNWATNRLAILMMFYPLRFRGVGFRRIGRLRLCAPATRRHR